jgi:hypothetical protein
MSSITLASSMVVALSLGVGSAACTTAEPPRSPATSILQAPTSSACPLGVPGAHVAADDTDSGIALTFTATAERLSDLRERAGYAAAMHGPGEHMGKGHEGRHGNGGEHGLKAMHLPPAYAVEEDIDGGARIVLRPADPNDLSLLRAKVRARAEAMMSSCS